MWASPDERPQADDRTSGLQTWQRNLSEAGSDLSVDLRCCRWHRQRRQPRGAADGFTLLGHGVAPWERLRGLSCED
jgi:hypothetical protein